MAGSGWHSSKAGITLVADVEQTERLRQRLLITFDSDSGRAPVVLPAKVPQRLHRANFVDGLANRRLVKAVFEPRVEADFQIRGRDFLRHANGVGVAFDHGRVILECEGYAEVGR